MLITRETDYALRILRSLAQGSCLTVGELAEKETLPLKFTYKIIKAGKSGNIRIIRGVNGGCRLERPHEVSLYDLVGAVETNARLAACMNADYQCEWRDKSGTPCNVHAQLARVQQAIDREFRSRSLYWILFGEKE
ncbi:MAG: RrF2 family transcriptional regulator [Eisenbergiella massiliensis]